MVCFRPNDGSIVIIYYRKCFPNYQNLPSSLAKYQKFRALRAPQTLPHRCSFYQYLPKVTFREAQQQKLIAVYKLSGKRLAFWVACSLMQSLHAVLHVRALNFPKIFRLPTKLCALKLPCLASFRQSVGSGGLLVARSLTGAWPSDLLTSSHGPPHLRHFFVSS